MILSVDPPPRDHIIALLELLEQHGDIRRIILEISINQDDHISCGIVDSGGDCSGLAEISTKFDRTSMLWIGFYQVFQDRL